MTEPEQQAPAALVENMLLLRKEDFDDLLDRAAERGAERCLAHLGLARIFHRSRATNEYGIALVCPKIQVSNLDQRAGNAEAKLYRRN